MKKYAFSGENKAGSYDIIAAQRLIKDSRLYSPASDRRPDSGVGRKSLYRDDEIAHPNAEIINDNAPARICVGALFYLRRRNRGRQTAQFDLFVFWIAAVSVAVLSVRSAIM